MDPLALTLIELGAVVFCLGLLARLAGRIGMSPIPLYLVGGLFFGAGGLVKLEGMHEFAHLSSEIGVILLLLMLGLEYTASELFTPDIAAVFVERAERIASSLKLAMFFHLGPAIKAPGD